MTTTATEATTELLTNSRMNTAKSCLRREYFAYEVGLRRITVAEYFRFGDSFHIGLDAWKQGEEADDAIVKALMAWGKTKRAGMDAEQEESWQVTQEQIARLLSGYFWRWGEMDAEMKVLETEFTFSIPLINPQTGKPSRNFTLAGKMDGIVKLPDGRTALIEHKTTGESIEDPAADYWALLRCDSQLSIYWQAAKTKGYDIDTALYDVIRKPTIRPKKLTQAETAKFVSVMEYYGEKFEVKVDGPHVIIDDERRDLDTSGKLPVVHETPRMYGARLTRDIGERPDYYYQRREIGRTQHELDDGLWDAWVTAKIIRDCQRENRWPKNTTQCASRGRCQYTNICFGAGYDPATDNIPEGYKIVENVNQEL